MDKNTFIMKTEWGKMISTLPDEAAGRIIKAVFSYVETGNTGEDDPVLSAILVLITATLDENAAKYEAKCKQNAENRARRNKRTTKSNDRTTTVNDRTSESNDRTHDNEYDNDYEYGFDNEFVNDNEYPSDTNKTSCGKRSKNRTPLEPEADTAAIPLNDGSAWRPSISLYETYEQSYPAVDIPQEFNKMRSWCLSNPKNCKTKNGIKRFVNAWLGKAQDHAARMPNGRASPYRSNSDVLLSIINGGA